MPSVVLGEDFELKLGCRNEYGLWRRADYGGEPIALSVELLSKRGGNEFRHLYEFSILYCVYTN